MYIEFDLFCRFYFKSNDSILGSTSNKSLKEAEKPEVTARPRIKVHASQRKTSQRQQSQSGTSQPLVNGDRVEDDSLMYINDISSIHDTRSNNLPGSSKKISIGEFYCINICSCCCLINFSSDVSSTVMNFYTAFRLE